MGGVLSSCKEVQRSGKVDVSAGPAEDVRVVWVGT